MLIICTSIVSSFANKTWSYTVFGPVFHLLCLVSKLYKIFPTNRLKLKVLQEQVKKWAVGTAHSATRWKEK